MKNIKNCLFRGCKVSITEQMLITITASLNKYNGNVVLWFALK